MFRRSRAKIVAIVMAVSVALLAGMLCVIYSISYMEMHNTNQEMLARYIDDYEILGDNIGLPDIGDGLPDIPGDIPDEEPGVHPLDRPDAIFELSTFYSVLYSEDGVVLEIDNKDGIIYSEEEILGFAEKIVEKGKESGIYKEFSYLIQNTSDGKLVVFLDNTVESENFTIILKYTLVFGGITLIIIFVLSYFLSDMVVKPLEQNAIKQKQFISDAGHELKTPIAVISTNLEMLNRELLDNKWVQNIEYETERMSALIKQLMELAKTESMPPAMDNLDFSHLIVGEILPFEIVAFEQGISLKYEGVEKDVAINGNAEQLKQLVAILLDNAIEHSQANSDVIVKMSTAKNKVLLSVANKGLEIPTEQREHLFERFYRGDYARNSESNHYGLGLAIAKAIVDTHKGSIGVDCKDGYIIFKAELSTKI